MRTREQILAGVPHIDGETTRKLTQEEVETIYQLEKKLVQAMPTLAQAREEYKKVEALQRELHRLRNEPIPLV